MQTNQRDARWASPEERGATPLVGAHHRRVGARVLDDESDSDTASDEEVDQALIMAAGIASRYRTGPRLETFR